MDVLEALTIAKTKLRLHLAVLGNVEMSLAGLLDWEITDIVDLFAEVFPPEEMRVKMILRIKEAEDLILIIERITDKLKGRINHPELEPLEIETFNFVKEVFPIMKENLTLWCELIVLRYNLFIRLGI
ncbi:hypothetical protein TNCV_3525551 [Trichonephila clavipes]|uniref:Uncharacterized protein n=1 Tax=Trichonephila clavipes TaxID=2585209 RepID=A0A8X6VGP7_TRICX|nr:hypothetical protein TNCV_3525551 [Trichonephila clavipes]